MPFTFDQTGVLFSNPVHFYELLHDVEIQKQSQID